VPTVRPFYSSPHICKAVKLGGITTPGYGHKADSLSRRLPPGLPGSSETSRGCHQSSKIFDKTRLDYKQRKIPKRTFATDRVSGNYVGYFAKRNFTASKENPIDRKRLKQNLKGSKVELGARQELTEQTKFCQFRNPSRKVTLQRSTKCSQPLTRTSEKENVPYIITNSSRMCLVARKLETKRNSRKVSKDNVYNIRRIRPRLGSSDRRQNGQRSMEPSSKTMAYKQEGTICGITSFSIGNDLSKREKGHNSVGQSDGCGVHQEAGRNSFSSSDNACVTTTPHSTGPEDGTMPSIYPGHLQRHSRQSISSETPGGLASFPAGDEHDILQMGNTRNRFICNERIQGSSSLCLSRRKGQGIPVRRCFQQNMAVQSGLDFSPSVNNSSSTSPPKPCERNIYHNSATVGESILEVRSEDESSGPPVPDSQPQSSPVRLDIPSGSSERPKLTLGGLEDTGWSTITADWHDEDLELLRQSWRPSTLKTYSAPWKTWLDRYRALGLGPYNPDGNSVARHLGYLFRIKKLSASTVKLHKSVIANFANPTKRESISNNIFVKQMVKAIDSAEPASIKKRIWDIKQLIDWMERNPVQEDSIFQVSRHLALLLLVASGRRVHDLTLLNINEASMLLTDTAVTFWPDFGSKTDSTTHRQSAWQLSMIPNEKLDPVRWTKLHLSLSETRRSTGNTQIDSLFITSRGPVKAASRAIIAGWIKTAFVELSLPFPPGSIRSAVASSRRDNNMPIDNILRNGNWRSERNVLKHYFKEVIRASDLLRNSNVNLIDSSFNTL
jgi:hypothetical protein